MLNPFTRIQALPDTPQAIDLRVVQEKDRILRTGPRIHHDASDGEMAGSMEADGALGVGIEATEVIAARLESIHDVRGLGVVGPLRMEVARQAPRVVAQAAVGVAGLRGDGAEVDGVVLEGALGDAAAAGAGVDGYGETEGADVDDAYVGGTPVTAH